MGGIGRAAILCTLSSLLTEEIEYSMVTRNVTPNFWLWVISGMFMFDGCSVEAAVNKMSAMTRIVCILLRLGALVW